MELINWGGNVAFSARELHRPTSIAQLQQLIGRAHRDRLKVKALGSRHSFSRVADTDGALISLDALPGTIEVDTRRKQVRVSAATRYGELSAALHGAGFAVPNLGSLPHISVSGACATGTHGSGDSNAVLAAAVSAIELVSAGGELLTLDADSWGDRFAGAVVALGSLGVVTTLTLDVEPAFTIRQYVYEGLALDTLAAHFDAIMSAAYSVSAFTRWRADEPAAQVWLKSRTGREEWDAKQPWFGARAALSARHPVAGQPPRHCTQQLGIEGPWHERLPHFRREFTPSTGHEIQSEYLVARTFAADAIRSIQAIADTIAPVLQIAEVRTVAADDLWLSPAYQQDSVALHFTWIQDMAAVSAAVDAVEHQLAPFAARPHWGKVFNVQPDTLAELNPRQQDFTALCKEFDPDATFDNPFLGRYFPR